MPIKKKAVKKKACKTAPKKRVCKTAPKLNKVRKHLRSGIPVKQYCRS
tara:strand:+ start:863 stop:1006 length:144 start_codon:yes stop_codon:yes gene_type:complete